MKQNKVNTFIFYLTLLLISLAFLRLISLFILDILIGVILSILFAPLYARLTRLCKGRCGLAAFLTVLVALVLVVLPALGVGFAMTREIYDLVDFIRNKTLSVSALNAWASANPVIERAAGLFQKFGMQDKLSQAGNDLAKVLVTATQGMFLGLTKMVFDFFIVLILVFFFLFDGERILNKIKSIFPIEESAENMVLQRLKSVIDATIKGALIIAVLEGTVGGLLLYAFGVPSPAVLAVVMMVFSFVPVLGTNTILVPVALFHILTGRVASGVTILAIGVGFVAFTQNVLKPKLVGDRAGLHPLLILLSTLGGLAWFGLVGFVVGPIIAAMFLTAWELFKLHFQAAEKA
ncbi:MAG: AI-2E family transporter [Fibrobacterota bacterium]